MHIFNTVHLKIVKVNLCYVFFYHNKGEKNKMDYNCHQKKEKFKSQLAEAKWSKEQQEDRGKLESYVNMCAVG